MLFFVISLISVSYMVLYKSYIYFVAIIWDDVVIDASQIPYCMNEIWNGIKAKLAAIDEVFPN